MNEDRDAHLRETPVSRSAVHQGRLISVYDDVVRFDDGQEAHREVVEHPGAVTVVAVDERQRVVLVRQWRHPAGRALWELPAGTRDVHGEPPEATAARELTEETGVRAARWRELGRAFLAPGYSSEEMHFYAASELEAGPAQAAADERLDVGWFDRDGVRRLVAACEVDVKTLAGLALAGWELRDGA